MLKTLIVLPDGTELFSGKVGENAILYDTFTDCVNSGDDLTLGSTCSNMLELTIWNPDSRLQINAGQEITAYKVDEAGNRHKIGIFIAEKPERPSRNIMRLTCYDRIVKLDTDLTDWLMGLTGWPYTLLTFAKMVCARCGLNFTTTSATNDDFPIYSYTNAGTTGRMLMQWLGEIAASFCRADADGNVEFSWYQLTSKIVTPNGKSEIPSYANEVVSYYYDSGLTYSDYEVTAVDAVQAQLGDILYPEVEAGKNVYVISENPFLYAAAIHGIAEEAPEEGDKEIIGYSYNGVVLPKLPDWDKTAYPYAYIHQESTGYYYLTCTPTPLVWHTNYWACETATQKEFVAQGTKQWKYYSNLDIYYAALPILIDPIWTNTTMTVQRPAVLGGNFTLPATDPVPAYDEDTPGTGGSEEALTPSVLKPFLKNILRSIQATARYRPCKVTIPAQLDIHAGDIFFVAYPYDPTNYFPTRCMIRTQKGQRDTLEATDSQRLDSVSAQYGGGSSGSSVSSQISTTALKVISTGKDASMSINGGALTMNRKDEKVLEVKTTDTVAAAILALKDLMLAATGNLSIYGTGNLSIGCNGTFSLGNYTMTWKDNGDGTYTPIGTPKQ